MIISLLSDCRNLLSNLLLRRVSWTWTDRSCRSSWHSGWHYRRHSRWHCSYSRWHCRYGRWQWIQRSHWEYRGWVKYFNPFIPGPGCSKLTTSLVNETLKFQTLISEICQYFLSKKCKMYFSTKNISVFGYKVVKYLRSWPLNELVKLTMLWTTGPWKPVKGS